MGSLWWSAPRVAPKIASPCFLQKAEPHWALLGHGSQALREPAAGLNALHLFIEGSGRNPYADEERFFAQKAHSG